LSRPRADSAGVRGIGLPGARVIALPGSRSLALLCGTVSGGPTRPALRGHPALLPASLAARSVRVGHVEAVAEFPWVGLVEPFADGTEPVLPESRCPVALRAREVVGGAAVVVRCRPAAARVGKCRAAVRGRRGHHGDGAPDRRQPVRGQPGHMRTVSPVTVCATVTSLVSSTGRCCPRFVHTTSTVGRSATGLSSIGVGHSRAEGGRRRRLIRHATAGRAGQSRTGCDP
jgi:hypothetical protein